MSIRRRIASLALGRPSSEEGRVARLQFGLLLVLSLLLNIGFERAREWQRVAEEEQLITHLLGWDGLAWYAWLLAAPFMLRMIRSHPLDLAPRLGRNLGWLLLWSVLLYLLVVNLRSLLHLLPNLWLPDEQGLPTDWHNYFYNTFRLWPLDFLTYGGFFAVSFALDYYSKYRRHAATAVQLQLRTARLESELTRAELAALRGQLHPHFLFNSFNALATLVRQRKNDQAVEIIAQLSALLRLAIDQNGLHETPLEEELDFIRRYLAIEQVRFGEKLLVGFSIEPEALGVLVPNIILQPLVENAVKHGISRRTTPGWVTVRARRRDDRLQIEIENDGADPAPAAIAPSQDKKPGIGLANTRARLTHTLGSDFALEINPRLDGGAVVSLNLPWRLAPQSSPPHEKNPHPDRR
ncbi:sensor histidine kinase [Opitutus sp. GAS368]|uniref:sensor histidine kinase n=1 Tax=Opitutus sp. GAS368 TaxID=1882749 RepID=UPI0012FD29E0|nr:sensor histidine kinase [Opitutus sp. GAS368]